MISRHIAKAIELINPSAKFTIYEDDTTRIDWLDGTTPISQKDIEDKLSEAEEIFNAQKYKTQRAEEYPSIKDQLDDLYHNGIDGWKATIKTTKDKYPKE